MATTVPILRAGEQATTFIYERVWGSQCTICVLAAEDTVPPALGAFELSGESLDPAFDTFGIEGETFRAVRGSVDVGSIPEDIAYGSGDFGLWSPQDPSPGSIELAAEGLHPALAVLVSRSLGSYAALSYLLAAYGAYYTSGGSVRVRDRYAYRSRATVVIAGDINEASRSTLETGQQTGYPAYVSLETGGMSETAAYGALDSQDGEGVDFLVDIQDEILESGGGLCD